MVYATTLHSPVHNSEPESWNDAEIKRMPGVIATVRLPHGIAIVAERFEQAIAGRNALKATWKPSQATNFNSEKRAREATSRSTTTRRRKRRPSSRRAT